MCETQTLLFFCAERGEHFENLKVLKIYPGGRLAAPRNLDSVDRWALLPRVNFQNLQNLQLFIHDTLMPLNFTNLKFDLVYSNLALQFFNLEQLTNILSNIKSTMKENAFFYFSTKIDP